MLAYANFSLPLILKVDSSLSGLGAVLSHEQDGKVRTVAYASRALTWSERNMPNYSSMKLEFLALKWAMTEKFCEYLLGQKCVVWTDNNPLSHLNTAKLGTTEQRWAAQLAAFDFSIQAILMSTLIPFPGSTKPPVHFQTRGQPFLEPPSLSP